MTHFNPQIHQRRSIRLKGYDYSQPGAYFITLVTYQRDCLFGSVIDGEMQLSALGKIAQDEWMRSISSRNEITIHEDEFVMMPNHLHGIVWIVDVVGADGVRPKYGTRSNDGVRPNEGISPKYGVRPKYGTRPYDGVRPKYDVRPNDSVRPKYDVRPNEGILIRNDYQQERGASLAPLHRKPRSLSSFVAGFKAVVTSRANRELNMSGIWQRNYFDHIIRDNEDFLNIWNYIDNNLQKWKEDQLNPYTSLKHVNQE